MSSFLIVGSDAHSDSGSFSKLTQLASDKECLSLIYCGDLDIDCWETGELLRNRNFSFLPVMGNCDSPWAWRDINMQAPPLFRKAEFFGLRMFVTHGHYCQSPEDAGLSNEDFDLVLSGHTHVPVIEKRNNLIYVNPGSVSSPRCYSEKSYAKIIFDKVISIQICALAHNSILSELVIPLNK